MNDGRRRAGCGPLVVLVYVACLVAAALIGALAGLVVIVQLLGG